MSAVIYLEGGGDAAQDARCREGFRKLIEKIVPGRRQPKLVACGGRNQVFDAFKTRLVRPMGYDYVGMLVDSEDPVPAGGSPWAHLNTRDGWSRPSEASDENVLFMATSMETWCCADRVALTTRYGRNLRANALPPLVNLESQPRRSVFAALVASSGGAYQKGRESFALLAELDPAALATYCPVHFVRTRDLLVRHCRSS